MDQGEFDKLEVMTLYHCVFFAYQKAVHDILGTGSDIFVSPLLDNVRRIIAECDVKLTESKTLDEAFKNLSRTFESSGVLKKYWVERLDPDGFILHIEGCCWAPYVHRALKPKDVICPYALIAMAMFEKFVGKVKPTRSEHSEGGARTVIQLLKE